MLVHSFYFLYQNSVDYPMRSTRPVHLFFPQSVIPVLNLNTGLFTFFQPLLFHHSSVDIFSCMRRYSMSLPNNRRYNTSWRRMGIEDIDLPFLILVLEANGQSHVPTKLPLGKRFVLPITGGWVGLIASVDVIQNINLPLPGIEPPLG
jgi:hypothetical protein